MKNLTVKLKMNDTQKILLKRGLDKNGKVQKFFTETVYKESAPYTPFRSGNLGKRANMEIGDNYLKYNSPYARYLWYGKLMVDPITRKGCFYDPVSGEMWSRPNVQKVLTDKDLEFQGAPKRGAFWVDRMFKDKGDKIVRITAKMVGGRAK